MLRHAFFVVYLPFRLSIKNSPSLVQKNCNNFETRKFPYYTSYSIHVITLKIADAKENNLFPERKAQEDKRAPATRY